MTTAAMTLKIIDRANNRPYPASNRNPPVDSVEKAILSDPMSIARAYLETWNETDGVKRQSLMKKYWADDGAYVDSPMSADGPQGTSGLAGAAHHRFPSGP